MSSHCAVQLWRRKARNHSAKLRPSSCRLGIAASSRHHKWHTVSNLLDTLSAYRGRASQNLTVQHLNWKVLPSAAPWSTLVDRCRPCRGLHEGVRVRSAWLACHRERRAAPISTFSKKGYSKLHSAIMTPSKAPHNEETHHNEAGAPHYDLLYCIITGHSASMTPFAAKSWHVRIMRAAGLGDFGW